MLGAETLAALGATRRQDFPAVLRRHARTEPVAPFALQVARLESPFGGHESLPLIPSGRRGNYMADPGKSSTRGRFPAASPPATGLQLFPQPAICK